MFIQKVCKLKLHIIITFFLLINQIVASDYVPQSIDSINVLLKHSKQDSNTVKLLLKVAESYINKDTKISTYYTYQALELTNKINWKYGKYLSYIKLSKSYYLMGDSKKSNNIAFKSLKYFEKKNNQEGIAVVSNQIGENYSRLQMDSLSIYYLKKSLAISKKINNIFLVKTNHTNLGALNARKGAFKKALEHYFEALKTKEVQKFENLDAIINGNIGSIYLELSQFEEALKYYQSAIKINEKNNNRISLAYNYYNLAVLYNNTNQSLKSIEYFDKVIRFQDDLNDNSMIMDCKSSKAIVLNTLGKYSEAIKIFKEMEKELSDDLLDSDLSYFYFSYGSIQIDYIKKIFGSNKNIPINIFNDAINNLEKSKFYLGKQDLMKSDIEVYQFLYKAYKLKNDYKKALANLEIYQQFSDSLYFKENLKVLNSFEQKLELEKKDKKLLLQQNTIKLAESKQIGISIALTLTVILLILGIYLYNIKHKTNISLQAKNIEVTELNNTKDKIFSIIAHDLLNPIINFKNVSEVLTDNYESFESKEHKEYLILMKESSIYLLDMLRNLLDWSRSQRGKIQTNIEIISLNDVIEQNIKLVTISANQKSIIITKKINNKILVKADYDLLSTVIRNVLSNSIKFSPISGNIIIEAVEVKDSNFIELSICDNGLGIPKEKLSNLFELSNNNSTIGTKNEKGTGLGLVLCKEFMDLMNCKIEIESEIEKGTKVKLFLLL